MKKIYPLLCCVAAVVVFAFARLPAKNERLADQLTGAWTQQDGQLEQTLLFVDSYGTHSVYSKADRKFVETRGGTYKLTGDKLNVNFEFDTQYKERTGQSITYNFSITNNELTIIDDGNASVYKRVDNAAAPLAGLWSITGRMQEGKVVPIHRTGTRKTIKILSGTRFQWAAIDPGQKQFSGTGGGTYEFANGKYTEHIEFFSRDSSRVGAYLSFDGNLKNGEWHHSGLSSRGDSIYEIWSRFKN